MNISKIKTASLLAFLFTGLLASPGVMAEKPDWAGGGKHGKAERSEMQNREDQHGQKEADDRHNQARERTRGKASHVDHGREDGHFRDEQRSKIHDYYSEQYHKGHCPPGLAKKHNGCLPPGQARKWTIGQPLPRNVIFYNLPPVINVQLGVAPAGQRYVRVAADILLIAIGTGMVMDAVQDIGRM